MKYLEPELETPNNEAKEKGKMKKKISGEVGNGLKKLYKIDFKKDKQKRVF